MSFKRNIARGSALVIAAFCLSLLASTARAQSVPGFQPSDKRTPANELSISQKAARGQAPLAKLYGHLKADTAKVRRLPALDQRPTKSEKDKRLQVGIVRSLPAEINPLTDSALYSVSEGDVRISQIVSTGASSTRIHFKGMSLPPGARVFVYSPNNPDEYFGPYVNRGPYDDGTFWTPPVPGDTAVVEYFTPAGTNSVDVPFTISEVAHIYKDEISSNAAAGSCNVELSTHPEWVTVAKSVGLIQFISGGTPYACTGTLLNDKETTTTPYFLTANHCISTQSEAQTATVYWNYLSGDFPSGAQTTSGADLLVTGTASDFSLLRLTGSVPTGTNIFFSGWDATPVSVSTSITGIHHPSASHKRISFGATNGDGVIGLPGPTQNFTGVAWSQGVTEPGSSGSGIWTGTPPPNGDPMNVKLVGNLYGGFSDCSNPTDPDYYGRFSVTYPNLAGFLSGSGSCVTSLNPGSLTFPATGSPATLSGNLTVNAGGGCNWTASSADAFVTITSGNSGSGSDTVNFSVAANPYGVPRTGSIVVGSQVFKINQQRNSDIGCAPKGTISLNGTVNGNLQAGCSTRDGQYVDAYTFNANAGQRVSVSMTSPPPQNGGFDTYLYLLNTDGTLLAVNDDNSGTNSRIPPGTAMVTLPADGTYTILPSAFCDANDSQCGSWSGAYTLTLSIPRTLTVASSNPNSNDGIVIAVNPTDINGASGNGTTQFTRTYSPGVQATLVAPGTAPNGNIFQKWQKDGVDVPSSTAVINVLMDVDHTMTAIYRVPNNYGLTVASSNPNSGVNIAITVNNGVGSSVMTPFSSSYVENTTITLTAPSTAPNGNVFQKWQKDGVDVVGNFLSFTMNTAHAVTAVYVPPVTSTMTVNASNPSTGVHINVNPTDNNGVTGGTAPFTCTYFQNKEVTLVAPGQAPNGNHFDRWLLNGAPFAFSATTKVTVGTTPLTMTAVFTTTPVIFLEQGTNVAAAINSVTFLRGPFQILDSHNFSTDGHTRIILFVGNVPGSDSSLGVTSANVQLPIEAVGQLTDLPGMTGTSGIYIVCKLPDSLSPGAQQLLVFYKGVVSDPVILNIAP